MKYRQTECLAGLEKELVEIETSWYGIDGDSDRWVRCGVCDGFYLNSWIGVGCRDGAHGLWLETPSRWEKKMEVAADNLCVWIMAVNSIYEAWHYVGYRTTLRDGLEKKLSRETSWTDAAAAVNWLDEWRGLGACFVSDGNEEEWTMMLTPSLIYTEGVRRHERRWHHLFEGDGVSEEFSSWDHERRQLLAETSGLLNGSFS